MKIGYIGLGKMGKNMVLRLLEKEIEVIAWNRSPEPMKEVIKAGAIEAKSIEDLVLSLRSHEVAKRHHGVVSTLGVQSSTHSIIIWLMLPAGEVTDEYLNKLITLLFPGDLIVDGANSFYKDTLRRAKKIKPTGIHFMDIGVSGGPGGARNGACMMIGGDEGDYKKILPVVKAGSAPKAYGYFGPVGTGHFTKMIHNGIEYGMMEAIAEGATILKFAPFKLNLAEVFRVYNNRSVIESRLVGWIREALEEDPGLSRISSEIKSTGEGEWTIKTAKKLSIKVPAISDSFKVRQNSLKDKENSPAGFRNKVVSSMRGKFGQHLVQKGQVPS